VVIGLASSGLHSNGFSLVRRLVDDGRLPLSDELLTPTRLYSPAVLKLGRVHGLAHITGGGLARNLPRAVARDLGIRVRVGSWRQPELFHTIARAADIDGQEMRATFNCGIGFAAVVEPSTVSDAIQILAENDVEAWPIGEVATVADLGGVRYLEA
jgi:phosphoribosylformylglycinamidine cyclo-ligase